MPDTIESDIIETDVAETEPDLSLVIGPDDDATFIMSCRHRNRHGWAEQGLIYAVVHRRFGIWTHVYRVVRDRTPTGLTVYLEKAIEGDCVGLARDWVLDRFGDRS